MKPILPLRAVRGGSCSVPDHLLDNQGGVLYRRKLRLDFALRVRGELASPDVAALKQQIDRDIGQIRRRMSRRT